jgi:hypothetical protein
MRLRNIRDVHYQSNAVGAVREPPLPCVMTKIGAVSSRLAEPSARRDHPNEDEDLLQSRLSLTYQFLKSWSIMFRHVGDDFSIELDSSFVQAFDKAAVG